MNNKFYLGLAIVVALGVVGYFLIYPQFSGFFPGQETKDSMDKNELQTETVMEGEGEGAAAGNVVTVHYIGTLSDGTKFDSSLDRGEPFTFTLGAGQVIAGWEQGIVGMKVGEKRRLVVPSELGYGAQAIGPIPANSTLIFEVEMLSIQK